MHWKLVNIPGLLQYGSEKREEYTESDVSGIKVNKVERLFEEAVVHLQRALDLDPKRIDVASNLGEILRDGGQHAAAVEVLRTVINQSSQDHVQENKHNEGGDSGGNTTTTIPDTRLLQTWYNLAHVLSEMGSMEQSALEHALKQFLDLEQRLQQRHTFQGQASPPQAGGNVETARSMLCDTLRSRGAGLEAVAVFKVGLKR